MWHVQSARRMDMSAFVTHTRHIRHPREEPASAKAGARIHPKKSRALSKRVYPLF